MAQHDKGEQLLTRAELEVAVFDTGSTRRHTLCGCQLFERPQAVLQTCSAIRTAKRTATAVVGRLSAKAKRGKESESKAKAVKVNNQFLFTLAEIEIFIFIFYDVNRISKRSG